MTRTLSRLILVLAALAFLWWINDRSADPTVPLTPGIATVEENDAWDDSPFPLGVIAEGLRVPWDMAFLPDGRIFVTEREGRLLLLDADGSQKELAILPARVHARGESGLLGIALHPGFAKAGWVYLYMTEDRDGRIVNSVWQYWFQDDELTTASPVIENIPGAAFHGGGRIEFGPDGLLYITTGDANDTSLAQDRGSLAGKILRVRDDGTVPPDNPFGTAVYSYGHRNPQGLAWDDSGRLWATEHGRSGISSGLDEINLVMSGADYGWPEIEGDATREGMIAPVAHSGAADTWAPASALFWDGSLFFGGLRGEALYEAIIRNERVAEVREHFKGTYGRIRTVRQGPDGMFYLTTSNTDGRGSIRPGDDRIIRLDPGVFR